MKIQGIDTQRDWLYSERYFRKNCIWIDELGLEPFIAKALSDLMANQWIKSWTVSRLCKPSQ